ncbi:MAG: hypothetical protein Q8P72_06710 [Candidatus Roizmanbacteria bacterium]|nr:hypothetical protein [Candidatus Roizmanbacteria bacterium]
MNKKLLFLVLFIVVLLALIPFVLTKDTSSKVALSTSIISALSSLLTLIIALLLYRQYGIESKLLEKNLESTEKLLFELGKVRITFKNNLSFIQFFPLKKEFYIKEKEIREYQKIQLIFSKQGLQNLGKISEFAYDPFLPKSIAIQLRSFEFIHGSLIEAKYYDKFLKTEIYVASNSTIDLSHKESDESYLSFNNEEITFQEYQLQWWKVVRTIHDWLKKNSSNYNELNL